MLPRLCPARSYQLAPPRFLLLALDAPQPEAPPPPQNISIEVAAEDDADSNLEYAIDAAEFPEVASNTVVLVDAAIQVSCPPTAAASPNLIRAVWIEGIFPALISAGDIIPVFEGP